MMVSALLLGTLAVFVAHSWLNRQAELRTRVVEAKAPAVPTRTVVVAGAPLRFGAVLSDKVLREVAWPEDAIPKGTFGSIKELLEGGKRTVLSSIEANEPIMAFKVTGVGQKATLSAVLHEGMKAVTIRVNDVDGVAGFVLPGDHVDVLLTRQPDRGVAMTDVVLQNLRVLAVDQVADDATDKPTLAKAVTLEVAAEAGQRLSLAASLGSLSLALRKAGETAVNDTRRISVSDLTNAEPAAAKRFITVVVTRSGKREEYSVPIEGMTHAATATSAAELAH
jgi:pilus assembly protein CpaB